VELPTGSKSPVSVAGLLNAEETRAVYGDGVFGGPYQAKQEIMDELFGACLLDVLDLLDRAWTH
jgi:creatinine amidohydrolase